MTHAINTATQPSAHSRTHTHIPTHVSPLSPLLSLWSGKTICSVVNTLQAPLCRPRLILLFLCGFRSWLPLSPEVANYATVPGLFCSAVVVVVCMPEPLCSAFFRSCSVLCSVRHLFARLTYLPCPLSCFFVWGWLLCPFILFRYFVRLSAACLPYYSVLLCFCLFSLSFPSVPCALVLRLCVRSFAAHRDCC